MNFLTDIHLCLSAAKSRRPALLIKSPLRVWSGSLILTLCRCCLTIPIYFNLLMRKIKWNLSNTKTVYFTSNQEICETKISNINNYNNSNTSHPVISSNHNSNNSNLKENERRPRKKITIWMRVRPKKNSARLPFSSRFFLIAVIFIIFYV
jgi:hypothetical protein